MPNPPTAAMGMELPTEDADPDVWDLLINRALEFQVDRHDHTIGKGVPIPAAALRIDDDVSWSSGGTPHAITDVRALDFAPVPASSIPPLSSALFVNSADSDNLYFRNRDGTNVKITNGASLDASGIGGIGGDYGAVGALVSYSDATRSYLFQQQGSPRAWAAIQTGDIDLFQKSTAITRVRLKSPNALAASYDLTFPAAPPSAVGLLAVDAGGNITARRTWTETVPAAAFQRRTGNASDPRSFNDIAWTMSLPPNDALVAPLLLPVGARVLSIVWHFNHGGVAGGFFFAIEKWTPTLRTPIASVNDNASTNVFTTRALSVNYTIEPAHQIFLFVGGSTNGKSFAMAEVTFEF